MPTYEYRCSKGHEFEEFQKISDPPIEHCPACGATAERLVSAGAGLVFKGSGFYITDYRKKPAETARSKERDASGKAESGGGTGGDGAKKGDGGTATGSPD